MRRTGEPMNDKISPAEMPEAAQKEWNTKQPERERIIEQLRSPVERPATQNKAMSDHYRAAVITPPNTFFPSLHVGTHSVFLAGAIDMGLAVDWQSLVIHQMRDVPCVLFNPRRTGGFTPDMLDEQIWWELNAMEIADTILMWFPADAKAPVAMFETGLWAQSGKLIVGADRKFYRRRNLELTLTRFGVEVHASLPRLIAAVQERIYSRS